MRFLSFICEHLFRLRQTERMVSETSPQPLFAHSAPTILEHSKYEWVTLLPYNHPLVAAHIIEAKFHNNKKAITALAYLLADYLETYIEDTDSFSSTPFSVVPIPLSRKRQAERGYNQVEVVCAQALAHLNKDAVVAGVLHRTRDTLPQTMLSRHARLKNMKEAFVGERIDPSRTYIVVDDVITTGATMDAACTALSKAGASHVVGVALAH